MVTITIDDSRLHKRMQELADVLYAQGKKSDIPKIFEQEMRLFLKQAISYTPPKTKAQGEGAIAGDLSRIFKAGNAEFLQHLVDTFGSEHVRHFLTNKAGEKYLVDLDIIDVNGDNMEKFHESKRGANGRVTDAGQRDRNIGRWVAHDMMTISYEAMARLKVKLFSHVGMLKSGWMKSYVELGGTLPSWITRHAARGLGGVVNNLSDPSRPSIRVSNHAPGVRQLERVMQNAVKARVRSIGRKIKLILAGYSADSKAKLPFRSHAQVGSDTE